MCRIWFEFFVVAKKIKAKVVSVITQSSTCAKPPQDARQV
jgi:hypothetical protein